MVSFFFPHKSSGCRSIRGSALALPALVLFLALSACGGGLPPAPETPPVVASPTQPVEIAETPPPGTPGPTADSSAAGTQPAVETGEPTAPPEPVAANFPGLAWSYPLGSPIDFDFTIGADGAIYTLGNSQPVDPESGNFATQEALRRREANLVTVVNPDGSLRGAFSLPKLPYRVPPTDTSDERPMLPVGLPDGTILVVSAENTVYGIGPTGLLLWEQPLEGEPFGDPVVHGATFYLLDQQARLYAFDANGLLWSLQSQAADNAAGDLALGPDGTAYYVATDFNTGFLQAVSPAGQDLWATHVATELFFNQPAVSVSGDLVSLREDLFDARSGTLLALESPVQIDEYVHGLDGNLYVRSGGSLSQVVIQGDRLEIVRQADPSGGSGAQTFPREMVVDQNGVLWLTYGEFPERELVWLSGDGELLGSFTLSFIQGRAGAPDYANSRVIICQSDENFESTLCGLSSPLEQSPIWEERFEDLPGFTNSLTLDGFTHLITWDGILYKIAVREP